MPRVRAITLDGVTLEISPMSLDEYDNYVEQSKKMLEQDPKPTPEDWGKRTFESVCFSLNKANRAQGRNGNSDWTPQRLRSELDFELIDLLHKEFLKMSGFRALAEGEAAATRTSS